MKFQVRTLARTPDAVLEATACVVGGGWGNYRQFHAVFGFYAACRRCRTFVARDGGGRVVATSVATRIGRSGWIGHVFVRPDLRGHGLGTRMTSAALTHLRRAGCDSILLASTELGRPIYERLGFKVESAYHELVGTPLPRTAELGRFRPLLPSDRGAWMTLDRLVAGDDRSALLSMFDGYAWGIDRGGRLAAAVVPLPWGGAAAAMLPDAGDADHVALVNLIRTVGASGTEVIVYPTDENRRALELLEDRGFKERRTVPRMVLGRGSEWTPAAVWNPLSLGLG